MTVASQRHPSQAWVPLAVIISGANMSSVRDFRKKSFYVQLWNTKLFPHLRLLLRTFTGMFSNWCPHLIWFWRTFPRMYSYFWMWRTSIDVAKWTFLVFCFVPSNRISFHSLSTAAFASGVFISSDARSFAHAHVSRVWRFWETSKIICAMLTVSRGWLNRIISGVWTPFSPKKKKVRNPRLTNCHSLSELSQSSFSATWPLGFQFYFWSLSRLELSGEQIVMHYRILTSPCNECSSYFFLWNNSFPNAGFGELSFAWHCCRHWCLQLPPCILNDVFVFFITWIKKNNSPHISGMFEFWILDCPSLLFSLLSGFSNSRPSVRSYVIWTWCRLDVRQSLSRPHISFWRSLV